jgi:hypothetical protein
MLRVIRSDRARPVADASENGIPRAEIDFATGLVRLDGVRWLSVEDEIPAEAIVKDAQILAKYLDSFRSFFGNAEGAIEVYWAFLVWLYAAPGCALSAAGRSAGWHRPLGLPGLCRAVWPIERRQDSVHQDRYALDVRL